MQQKILKNEKKSPVIARDQPEIIKPSPGGLNMSGTHRELHCKDTNNFNMKHMFVKKNQKFLNFSNKSAMWSNP